VNREQDSVQMCAIKKSFYLLVIWRAFVKRDCCVRSQFCLLTSFLSIMDGTTTPTPSNSSRRRRFANFERLAIVRNVRRCVKAGESIRGKCRALNIIPKQHREWLTISRTMMEHGNSKAKSTAKGPTSVLAPIENDLLKFI
jgi:hypothetical protein